MFEAILGKGRCPIYVSRFKRIDKANGKLFAVKGEIQVRMKS